MKLAGAALPWHHGPMPVGLIGFDKDGDTAIRVWHGETVTDDSGGWSIDYSAATFGGVPLVFVGVVDEAVDIVDDVVAKVRTRTATQATGIAYRGVALSELGPTRRPAPAGIPVMVLVVGPPVIDEAPLPVDPTPDETPPEDPPEDP